MFICLRVNERRLVVQGTSHGRSIEAERNALSVNRLLDEVVVTNIHISDLWKVNELSRLTEERKERN